METPVQTRSPRVLESFSNVKMPGSPETFEYEPLPTKTSIRLVSIFRTKANSLPSLICGVPQIRLALETVDLQDNPEYEALSYTWGSPFPDSSEKAKAYQGANSQWPILVNGRVHYVRRNLYEFLHQSQPTICDVEKRTKRYQKTGLIHAAERGDRSRMSFYLRGGANPNAQDVFGDTALHYAAENGHFEVVRLLVYYHSDVGCLDRSGRTPLDCAKQRKRRQYTKVVNFLEKEGHSVNDDEIPPGYAGKSLTKPRRLWIDSICTNQNDIPERNAQVAAMSQIYSKAASVIVWLGVQDNFTEPACQALEDWEGRGARDGVQAWFEYVWSNALTRTPMEEFILSKERTPTATRQCVAIARLLEHTWFHRVWVMQEWALAAQIHMLCGNAEIQYMFLITLQYFVRPAHEVHLPGIMQLERILQSARWEGVCGIEATVLADVRVRTTKHEYERDYLLNHVASSGGISPVSTWEKKLSLQDLGTMIWFFQASDPRDKVFALLGLARAQDPGRQIIADYSKPTAEVFITYGKLFMEGAPDEPIQEVQTGKSHVLEYLEGLSYVQDTQDPHPRFLNYKSKLPSWTPNFSATLAMHRIWSSGFSAGIVPGSPTTLPRQDDPRVLRVEGLLFDEIVSIESYRQELGDHKRITLHWLELILALHPIYIAGGNRVEALWRTLTANQVRKSADADACARGSFKEFMCKGLCHSLDDPCLASWLIRLQEVDALSLLPSLDDIVCEQHKKKGILEIPTQASFVVAMKQHYRGRCLFRTKKGYLGLGSMAVQPGDEVWLVSGARTPFILRKSRRRDLRSAVRDAFVQRTQSGNRRFIGESYMHGIMNGEGIFHTSQRQFSPVSLV